MARKLKVSPEIKISVVEEYLAGEKSLKEITETLKVHKSAVQGWVRKYKTWGKEGLLPTTHNTNYSYEIKIKAVSDYLAGNSSSSEICDRYKLSTIALLQQWIKKYNGHNIGKSHNAKGAPFMTNGRKTTYKERVDIVAFCIDNANDYEATANKHKVSYQQVYTWVRKCKANGVDALVDRRGKRKSSNELNESEKVTAQMKLLEAENRRLKLENDFLKKLKEIERW